jgi:Rieske Fe-S protein
VAATTPASPSRRDLVRLGGATVGIGAAALALGACSSEEPTVADAGEGAPATTASSGGTTVTALADVPVGSAVIAEANGEAIVVAQPEAGKVVAFSAKCTHKGCTVKLKDATTLECPCHFANFEALTGVVTKGPATANLPAVAVAVQGDDVVTA